MGTLCDPNQLESALLNLAINARDAMPDGGRLVIATANARLDSAVAAPPALSSGEYICISVTDTGVGMSAEVRRAPSTRSSRPSRSGRAPVSGCRWSMASRGSRTAT